MGDCPQESLLILWAVTHLRIFYLSPNRVGPEPNAEKPRNATVTIGVLGNQSPAAAFPALYRRNTAYIEVSSIEVSRRDYCHFRVKLFRADLLIGSWLKCVTYVAYHD